MVKQITFQWIKEYRQKKWRIPSRTLSGLNFKTESEAESFINEVNICLLFGGKQVELPKWYTAAHPDSDWWTWKDTLQVKKKLYLSRVVKKKATLLSLDLLPYFLALYYASGGDEIYEEEHFYGHLSAEAYRIAQYLDEHGATATDVLRKQMVPKGKKNTAKFHKALLELQVKFKIAVAGLDQRGWGVRKLDLFTRWAPKSVLQKAEKIDKQTAMKEIIIRYISLVGATNQSKLARLFGWEQNEVEQITQQYIAEGKLVQVKVGNQLMLVSSG
jgi:hypothetical protein